MVPTSMGTMVVLAGRYTSEKAAFDDFQSVKNFYNVSGLVDTYDAAFIHSHIDRASEFR